VQNLTIKLFSAMNMTSFAVILLVTHFGVHGPLRVQVLGWICVSISVSVFAAPLSIVVRTQKSLLIWYVLINYSIASHARTYVVYILFYCDLQAQVVRTKSVEFMPFNLSFTLTLSAIMWFGYGLFLKDICIAVSIYAYTIVQFIQLNYIVKTNIFFNFFLYV